MGSVTRKTGKKAPSRKAAKATKKPAARKKAGTGKKKKAARTTPPDLDVDPDVLELIEAIDDFKKLHNRPFPSWSEVLYVLRQLGYTKD